MYLPLTVSMFIQWLGSPLALLPHDNSHMIFHLSPVISQMRFTLLFQTHCYTPSSILLVTFSSFSGDLCPSPKAYTSRVVWMLARVTAVELSVDSLQLWHTHNMLMCSSNSRDDKNSFYDLLDNVSSKNSIVQSAVQEFVNHTSRPVGQLKYWGLGLSWCCFSICLPYLCVCRGFKELISVIVIHS